MDFAQRAARNEEIFRDVNERIDEGAALHDVAGTLPYHCECGTVSCLETLELRPRDYDRVMAERYRFVVAPGHEDPDLEVVVETHDGYVVVEKIGEAREQLDRDHPQQRHSSP